MFFQFLRRQQTEAESCMIWSKGPLRGEIPTRWEGAVWPVVWLGGWTIQQQQGGRRVESRCVSSRESQGGPPMMFHTLSHQSQAQMVNCISHTKVGAPDWSKLKRGVCVSSGELKRVNQRWSHTSHSFYGASDEWVKGSKTLVTEIIR